MSHNLTHMRRTRCLRQIGEYVLEPLVCEFVEWHVPWLLQNLSGGWFRCCWPFHRICRGAGRMLEGMLTSPTFCVEG